MYKQKKRKKAASGYTTIAQTSTGQNIQRLRTQYGGNDDQSGNWLGSLVGGMSGGLPGLIAAPLMMGIQSVLNERRQNQEADLAERARIEEERVGQAAFNDAAYATQPAKGTPGVTRYYRYGGSKKMASGGTMQMGGKVPLGSNVNLLNGARHEQGGINVGNGIEAEDQEVTYTNPHTGATTIFSDRIGTGDKSYAKIASSLGVKKGRFEKLAKNADTLVSSTAKRNLQKNRVEMDGLVAAQIKTQMSRGIDPSGESTYAATGLTDFLPYVDNLVNLAINQDTPELPKPREFKTVPFRTEYNVKPQIAAVDQQQAGTVAALKDSTAFGPQRRNAIIASSLSTIGAKSNILGQKENIETELTNRDAANRQQVLHANTQNKQHYDMLEFQRDNEIQGRTSENAANFAEDAQFQISEERLKQRDAAEIALLKERYNRDGIFDRNIDKSFEDYLSGKITYNEFQKQLADRTAAVTGGTTQAGKISPSGQTKITSSKDGAGVKPSEDQYRQVVDKFVLPYIKSIMGR